MPEVMRSWKGSQKYSKIIHNCLLVLWLDNVTHPIQNGVTRSKCNDLDYCIKGKKIRHLRVVID